MTSAGDNLQALNSSHGNQSWETKGEGTECAFALREQYFPDSRYCTVYSKFCSFLQALT